MIRLLIIEDNDLDVELARQILQLRGLNFEMVRVATRKAFIHELMQHRPDLILSDHGLASFDGLSAFRLAKQVCPDVPFIFLSGGITVEDQGRLSAEAGVKIIHKQDIFAELAPAIRDALGSALCPP